MEGTNGAVCVNEMEKDFKEIKEKYGMYFDLEKKNRNLSKDIDNMLNAALVFLAVIVAVSATDLIYKIFIIPYLF